MPLHVEDLHLVPRNEDPNFRHTLSVSAARATNFCRLNYLLYYNAATHQLMYERGNP
jgi:hypothetical protein